MHIVVRENINILFPPYKGSLEIWWSRGEGVLKVKIIKGKYEAKLETPMCDFKIRWVRSAKLKWDHKYELEFPEREGIHNIRFPVC